MSIEKIFVENLKKWRKTNKFSQEKLANLAGFTYSYLRQIECGSRCPSMQFIGKIAEALKIEPYQLFLKENAPPFSAPTYEELRKSKAEAELIEAVSKNIHAAFEKI